MLGWSVWLRSASDRISAIEPSQGKRRKNSAASMLVFEIDPSAPDERMMLLGRMMHRLAATHARPQPRISEQALSGFLVDGRFREAAQQGVGLLFFLPGFIEQADRVFQPELARPGLSECRSRDIS